MQVEPQRNYCIKEKDMFKATRIFISFSEVTDPTKHQDYNIWHQLDHRPENLALPTIAYGERWVSTPACTKARQASDSIVDKAQYFTMYWFLEPMTQAYAEFTNLAETSLWMGGRRPEMAYTKRHFCGFFLSIKGYVNPRVLVSPEALVYRPTRGIFLTMSDILEPGSAEADAMLDWYDKVHIPDMLQCKGVAGAWTFAADLNYGNRFSENPNQKGRIIQLYYLDEDPLTVVADIQSHVPQWKAAGRMLDNTKAKKNLFIGPLQTIIPWQWDWFD
ncbi:hypothetical protein ACFLWX_02680 [Chloroflexota bacterium]